MNLIKNTPQESEKSLTGNRQTPLEHSLRHFVGWFIVQEITVVTITKWERKKKKSCCWPIGRKLSFPGLLSSRTAGLAKKVVQFMGKPEQPF